MYQSLAAGALSGVAAALSGAAAAAAATLTGANGAASETQDAFMGLTCTFLKAADPAQVRQDPAKFAKVRPGRNKCFTNVHRAPWR